MSAWKKLVQSGNFKKKVKRNISRILNTQQAVQLKEELCISTSPISSKVTDIDDSRASCSNEEINTQTDESVEDLQRNTSENENLSDDEDQDFARENFKENLKEWALRHNIKHVAIKDLLQIINTKLNVQLPQDPRTLLATKKNVLISKVQGGEYFHYGIFQSITDIFAHTNESKNISININIDGLPPFKSSKYEFWPILFNIHEMEIDPMIIGLYYGKGKPGNSNEFLTPFVNEMLAVIEQGVNIGPYKINVTLRCFICDSPARAYIKGVANFNSQHGCQKCWIVGEYSYEARSNYYPNKCYPLRSDQDFREKKDEDHHKIDTVLLKLPINMIDSIPIADSLHLLDLGVMKRCLMGWRDGKFKNNSLKWSAKEIENISKRLEGIKLPTELHRSIRGLDCLSHWKGLEYRHFILYVGIVILKDVVRPDVYEHFLSLFCAVTICSTSYYQGYLEIAENLFSHFVDYYSVIYGEHFITSNIHNLTHIVNDVRIFGNLSTISAYPFESKLFVIKNLLRSGNKPLIQVAKRLMEKQQNLGLVQKSEQYPVLKDITYNQFLQIHGKYYNLEVKTYQKILFKEFSLGGNDSNSWFLTKDDEVVRFEAVANINEKYLMCGRKIKHLMAFFETPIKSTHLNIFTAFINLDQEKIFPISDIKCKLVHVINNEQSVFVPMLHTLC